MKKSYVLLWVMFVLFVVTGLNLRAQEKQVYSLDDCIKIALQNNSQLRNAARDVKIAGADLTSATSTYLPDVDLRLSSGRVIQGERQRVGDVPVGIDSVSGNILYEQREYNQKKTERNSHYAYVQLGQNLWDWGRGWYGIKQGMLSKKNAKYTLMSQKNAVIYNVKMQYFELLKAIKLGNVYQEAVGRSEEQLKRTESMYELGSVALADVYKAKVNLGNDKIYLINQKNKIIEAKANFNNALGLDPKTYLEIEMIDPQRKPLDLTEENALQAALEMNPELKSYELNALNYKYEKRKAMIAFLPTIYGYARYSRDNEIFNRMYNKNFDKDYTVNIGAQVDLNIFNGFADKAEVQRQSLNYAKANEDLIEKKRTLKAEVTQAFLALKAYKEISEINEDILQSAMEDLRLAQERYTIGAGTLLELIDSQLTVTQARATLVSAKFDTQIALAYLYSLMSRLDQE